MNEKLFGKMKMNVKELYGINPEILSEKKRCIFGTGTHAKQTYVDLFIQGIQVDYFVDRDVSGTKNSYMGIPIINEEKLKELDASVIIASTAWKDIADRLKRQGISDIYVDLRRYGEVDVQENVLYSVGKYGMKKDTLYILCPAGVGDTLYVAAYSKAVKECYKGLKKVCLITKRNHSCIGAFFEGVDEVISSDELVEQLDLYSISTKTWYLKNYMYGHFKKNLCQTFDREYTENKNIPILDYYKKYILKIPVESKPDTFRYNMKNTGKIKELISEKRKFIILMPYANTAEMLPVAFWEKCASFFVKKNYQVYTNVKDATEQIITGTLPMQEDIYNMVGICNMAELVISIRNGMCDVLAMGKAPLIVLDTDREFYEKWNMNQWNLNMIHMKCFEYKPEEMWEKFLCLYESLKKNCHLSGR